MDGDEFKTSNFSRICTNQTHPLERDRTVNEMCSTKDDDDRIRTADAGFIHQKSENAKDNDQIRRTIYSDFAHQKSEIKITSAYSLKEGDTLSQQERNQELNMDVPETSSSEHKDIVKKAFSFQDDYEKLHLSNIERPGSRVGKCLEDVVTKRDVEDTTTNDHSDAQMQGALISAQEVKKEYMAGVIKVDKVLPAEDDQEDLYLQNVDEIVYAKNPSHEMTSGNISTQSASNFQYVENNQTTPQNGALDKDTAICRKHKTQKFLSGPIMDGVINVFITWTTSVTGEKKIVKWSHQSCDECSNKFEDWKQHVMKKHDCSVDIAQGDWDAGKDIPLAGGEERAEKVLKSEMSNSSTSLDSSISCLVNLVDSVTKSVKNTKQSLSWTERSNVKESVNRRSECVKARSEREDVKVEQVEVQKSAQSTSLLSRRKRGRPAKGKQNDGCSPGYVKIMPKLDRPKILPTDEPSKTGVIQIPPLPGATEGHSQGTRYKQSPRREFPCSREECGMVFSMLKDCKAHEKDAHRDTPYKCSYEGCRLKFQTKVEKTRHEMYRHQTVFECQYCELTFSNVMDRANHSKTHVSYKCGFESCDKNFVSERGLMRHQKIHSTTELMNHDTPYRCSYEGCGLKFQTKVEKTRHEMYRHQTVFECQYCELTFSNVMDRANHSKTHVSYKCGFESCDKSFVSERGLMRHQKIHSTSTKSIQCPVCPKAFTTFTLMRVHMKDSHKKTNLPCDLCPKTFKSKRALENHRTRHTGQPHVCQFCGKKVNSKASLDRHERVHKGEKPYRCKTCGMKFVCHNLLRRHERFVHAGVQYICDKCGKAFQSKTYMERHRTVHTGEKLLNCDVCGKAYRHTSSLWKHKLQNHSGGVRRYSCKICNKRFKVASALYTHKTTHSSERRYECQFCGKRFANSGGRSAHIKQVHRGIKRKSKKKNQEQQDRPEHEKINEGHQTQMESFTGDHKDSIIMSSGSAAGSGTSSGVCPRMIEPQDGRHLSEQVPLLNGDPSQSTNF